MNFHNVSVFFACFVFVYTTNRTVIQISNSHLRIRGGQVLPDQQSKGYMVYLTKASESPKKYDHWICGGAIVSPRYIITSAACVEDVQYMYAIAGYTKYVPHDKIHDDRCTKQVMRKIIRYCVPKAYTFEYEKLETWANIDIAVAEVNKPYNFHAGTVIGCTHKFSPIKVNYHKSFQKSGTNCMVMGWGHTKGIRKPGDKKDYNEQNLQYASTVLINKTSCIETFEQISTTMRHVVQTYMLCAGGQGIFNAAGEIINEKDVDYKDGCDLTDLDKFLKTHKYSECISKMYRSNLNSSEKETLRQRRNGICQNDHGGPLVTWIGTHEYLIGVASVFNLGQESECKDPYLYTSTYCNSGFLQCILKGDTESIFMRSAEPVPYMEILNSQIDQDKPPVLNMETVDSNDDMDIFNYLRSDIDDFCNKPAKERGFQIIDQVVSWPDATDKRERPDPFKNVKTSPRLNPVPSRFNEAAKMKRTTPKPTRSTPHWTTRRSSRINIYTSRKRLTTTRFYRYLGYNIKLRPQKELYRIKNPYD